MDVVLLLISCMCLGFISPQMCKIKLLLPILKSFLSSRPVSPIMYQMSTLSSLTNIEYQKVQNGINLPQSLLLVLCTFIC